MRSLFRIPALVVLLAFAAAAVWSQSSMRTVTGTVKAASGEPVKGAVVKLKDTVTLQIRSFVSTDDGSYRFSNLLEDRDYEVQAQRGDKRSSTKTISRFSSRQQSVVDLQLPD